MDKKLKEEVLALFQGVLGPLQSALELQSIHTAAVMSTLIQLGYGDILEEYSKAWLDEMNALIQELTNEDNKESEKSDEKQKDPLAFISVPKSNDNN